VELKSTNVAKFIEHALQHGRRKVAAVAEKKAKPAKPAKPANINSSLQLLGQAYKLAIANGRLSTAPRIRKLSEVGNARQGFFSLNGVSQRAGKPARVLARLHADPRGVQKKFAASRGLI
jgi:hypothetical protein